MYALMLVVLCATALRTTKVKLNIRSTLSQPDANDDTHTNKKSNGRCTTNTNVAASDEMSISKSIQAFGLNVFRKWIELDLVWKILFTNRQYNHNM